MLVSTGVNNVAYFIVYCNIRVQGKITLKVLAHYCVYGTAFRFEYTGKISSKVGSLPSLTWSLVFGSPYD